MSNTYHAEPSEIPVVLRGGYTGRRFQVVITDEVTPHGMQWDGGSRNEYAAINLATGEHREIVDRRPWPQNMGAAPLVSIEPGWVVRQRSIFCGKDHGLTIYCRPENAPKRLEAPSDVDESMEVVLVATRTLKNSYGGRTNIRFEEAARQTGITEHRWLSAVERCQAAGYLRKNGSITPAGRNAIANTKLRIY